MTTKEQSPLHKKAFPYILLILGLLVGLALAIDWNVQVVGVWDVSFKSQLETEKSAWDIIAAVGSFFAGFSTLGLLIFGTVKSNEWIKQIKENKRFDLSIKSVLELQPLAEDASIKIHLFLSNLDINTDFLTPIIDPKKSTLNPRPAKPIDKLTAKKVELLNELKDQEVELLMLLFNELESLKAITWNSYSLYDIDKVRDQTIDLISSITMPLVEDKITTIGEYKDYEEDIKFHCSNLVVELKRCKQEWLEELFKFPS